MRYVIVFVILLAQVISLQPAMCQSHTPHKVAFTASVGNRGTTTEFFNIYDEKITQIDRSSDLVFGQIYFQKSDRLALWLNYTNGLNPVHQVLAGLDRLQRGVYAGGKALASPYTIVFEYGYQTFEDSLYQDNLRLDHSFVLPSGLKPRISTGIGIGNEDHLEWVLQGGVEIPLSRSLFVEPLYILVKHHQVQYRRSRLGVRGRLRLLDNGGISAGFVQEINSQRKKQDAAFMIQAAIPFLERHLLHFTIHKNFIKERQITLVALGLSTGIGKMNMRGNSQ